MPGAAQPAGWLRSSLTLPLIGLIRLWQLTRYVRPPVCRFYPSCSSYGIQALQKYGAVKGSWLTARRICRCHPFHPGGYDPLE